MSDLDLMLVFYLVITLIADPLGIRSGNIEILVDFFVKDQLFITIQEKINICELANEYVHFIPSIGISYKFRFNVNNAYLKKNDWGESEMQVSTAYKNVYKTVNAISADVDIALGLKDETPPVIQLWEE